MFISCLTVFVSQGESFPFIIFLKIGATYRTHGRLVELTSIKLPTLSLKVP